MTRLARLLPVPAAAAVCLALADSALAADVPPLLKDLATPLLGATYPAPAKSR